MPDGLAPADPRMTHWRRPKTLASQLESLGVKPADIKYVAVSHTHPDHIGNVELFPQAMLLVQKAEYELAEPARRRALQGGTPGDQARRGLRRIQRRQRDSHLDARSPVAAGEIAKYRGASALGRCGSLQEQLGKSRRAFRQHRQGQDAGLDAAYLRCTSEGEGAALDQSRQGATRQSKDGARLLRLRLLGTMSAMALSRHR
jgi:Metallo-beta-lactamase superfamily